MDTQIEANRNSALFNTMQEALDVYNPLIHKARPTTVNQAKHRINVAPIGWGNTLQSWNGRRTARFDIPRIASVVDVGLKVAFRMPGVEPTNEQRRKWGDRGFAKTSLSTGGLDNTNSTNNTAKGRLDRIYADNLIGFNMIERYRVSSKSRQIFTATREYLQVRFSQMDKNQKEAVFRSITPVDVMSSSSEDMFYAPGITYQMSIPLFVFFNEDISNALDVNFSEEVHVDIDFVAPSSLFFYGNIGDLSQVSALHASGQDGYFQRPRLSVDNDSGLLPWDQSTNTGSKTYNTASGTTVTKQQVSTADITAAGTAEFGTSNIGYNNLDGDVFVAPVENTVSDALVRRAMKHIQGVASPWDSPSTIVPDSGKNDQVGINSYFQEAGYVTSGPTFAYPDVDNNGESPQIQFELVTDYLVQDTDAARALREQQFPEGTGLTSIVYNTAQEVHGNLFASPAPTNNLLAASAGGSFVDPSQSASGITVGDSTRYVDVQLRNNNLCSATHFMVRKHSDLESDRNTIASKTSPIYGKAIAGANKKLGAHRIYTRCLPVHYFQLLVAGRVLYESDGQSQLNITQSQMYAGTGNDWGKSSIDHSDRSSVLSQDNNRDTGRPFYIYSINFGIHASRLENTGCNSYQNQNNPTLRIYLKPDTWEEHQTELSATADTNGINSEAKLAASYGVQVDVIHEHFNVVTINSGNGEITSGLNQ